MYFNQVEFGKRIRDERAKLGMTQEELADDLNISHGHLNKIEKGKEGCSIDLLLELADYFGVSTDFLLVGKRIDSMEIKARLQGVISNLSGVLKELDR
ncbi:MAG: helix-turn-helix domain-containing protein [Eubacterium sp.]|nr:helix-turn-helix domain-containing protein [Eubacterium sp.]